MYERRHSLLVLCVRGIVGVQLARCVQSWPCLTNVTEAYLRLKQPLVNTRKLVVDSNTSLAVLNGSLKLLRLNEDRCPIR